jgi:hypothetical protein
MQQAPADAPAKPCVVTSPVQTVLNGVAIISLTCQAAGNRAAPRSASTARCSAEIGVSWSRRSRAFIQRNFSGRPQPSIESNTRIRTESDRQPVTDSGDAILLGLRMTRDVLRETGMFGVRRSSSARRNAPSPRRSTAWGPCPGAVRTCVSILRRAMARSRWRLGDGGAGRWR